MSSWPEWWQSRGDEEAELARRQAQAAGVNLEALTLDRQLEYSERTGLRPEVTLRPSRTRKHDGRTVVFEFDAEAGPAFTVAVPLGMIAHIEHPLQIQDPELQQRVQEAAPRNHERDLT